MKGYSYHHAVREVPKIMTRLSGSSADDYVTKPFNPMELVARVKSQFRRYTQCSGMRMSLSIGEWADQPWMTIAKVTADGRSVTPTATESRHIEAFSAESRQSIFNEQIEWSKLYGWACYNPENTVAVHIRYERKRDTKIPGIKGKVQQDISLKENHEGTSRATIQVLRRLRAFKAIVSANRIIVYEAYTSEYQRIRIEAAGILTTQLHFIVFFYDCGSDIRDIFHSAISDRKGRIQLNLLDRIFPELRILEFLYNGLSCLFWRGFLTYLFGKSLSFSYTENNC